MLFSDLHNIIEGNVLQQKDDLEIIQLAIDSRNISSGHKNTLFFAINGNNHNGHNYILELYQQGIRQFVIEQHIDTDTMPAANFILVNSTLEALQSIGKSHRELFNYPVIGITGSNGKTITKEWLYHLISPFRNTVKNPKSYNSQVGVPLSIWHMNKYHELGIFEAGISTLNEMQNLVKIVQPTIGVITNIGSAHDEGFKNRAEKLIEKLILFKNCDQLIYCKDHLEIHQHIIAHKIPATCWSLSSDADISFQLNKQSVESSISIKYGENSFDCIVPLVDDASIENALHCISIMLYLGFTSQQIQLGLEKLPIVKMRLELKPGINGCQIIDDTYNTDLAGLEVAINFLSQQSSLKRTVILSDILQSGLVDNELYSHVANLINSNEITRVIGVGKNISSQKHHFTKTSVFYDTTKELIADLDNLGFNNEAILVKGARPFKFEQITTKLAQKIHGTILEIDLNALTHNLNFYRQHLKKETRLMVMVKAMAYGSGSDEIAHLLAHHKVDYLGVAYVDEGITLRKKGIETPIMVMNVSPDGFENILNQDLEAEIYNLNLLKQFIQFLNGKKASIHLKIDTGMRRLGFQPEESDELITSLLNNSNLHIKSIFSHLVGSDEAIHNGYSHQQVNILNKVYDKLCDALEISPTKHIVNSSGILRFPEYHFDMVRLGIGLYGIDSNQTYQDHLLPISRLKTTISQINRVRKGQTIGYGRNGKANKDLTIATIAIGYADGFSRAFSNGKGQVLINDQQAPVIGNVCMDMTMIDVTDIDANVGDEIIVFGDQMPISTLADKLKTIPYEILTNISERVKRVYFQD